MTPETENLIGDATYCASDNKLRLYPVSRLPDDVYARVKEAGFSWAPKQELFVAPKWTPDREDLLIELCGEIGDEEKTPAERAAERAERFEDYSEKRQADAESARRGVLEITKHIPFGQPILVGHHSERHARRDAERIENGMRRAVNNWETSKYWASRAAGSVAAADYKDKPQVRARRIKGLEADLRSYQRRNEEATEMLEVWAIPGLTREIAIKLTSTSCSYRTFPVAEYPRPTDNPNPESTSTYEGDVSICSALNRGWINVDQARAFLVPGYEVTVKYCVRWIKHFEHRLAYEKAMLEAQGALHLIAPKARPTQLPLLNYRQATFQVENPYRKGDFTTLPQVEMTKAEFAKVYEDRRGTRTVEGSHRVRYAILYDSDFPRLREVLGANATDRCLRAVVFLTDSATHKKPAPVTAVPEAPQLPPETKPYSPPPKTEFDAMKDSLKAGVKVVAAPQLFPTPQHVARQMVELAGGVMAGRRILEPSAGTGVLVRVAADNATGFQCCRIVAVEVNQALCQNLEGMRDKMIYAQEHNFQIVNRDFLGCTPEELGTFDVILMNPPFANGADIMHIEHAMTFLKPGGKLVAICADGPRQGKALGEIADHWQPLPEGTFAEQGTNVRTVMLRITR